MNVTFINASVIGEQDSNENPFIEPDLDSFLQSRRKMRKDMDEADIANNPCSGHAYRHIKSMKFQGD